VKLIVLGFFLMVPCLGCGLLAVIFSFGSRLSHPATAITRSHELSGTELRGSNQTSKTLKKQAGTGVLLEPLKHDDPKKSQISGSSKSPPISIPPTGVVRISAVDLLAHFRADRDAAERVFRDRTVEVTGNVAHVYKTKAGQLVVTFGEVGRVLSPKVDCYFRATDNPKVTAGQLCIIQGRCMGKNMGVGTWLQECKVISAPQ
jgi:hypothetical protein